MKTFKTDEDLFDEMKDKYTKLIAANRTLFEENVARGKKIDALEAFLDEAFRILDRYTNVPESLILKTEWKKFKRKPKAPASPESNQSP